MATSCLSCKCAISLRRSQTFPDSGSGTLWTSKTKPREEGWGGEKCWLAGPAGIHPSLPQMFLHLRKKCCQQIHILCMQSSRAGAAGAAAGTSLGPGKKGGSRRGLLIVHCRPQPTALGNSLQHQQAGDQGASEHVQSSLSQPSISSPAQTVQRSHSVIAMQLRVQWVRFSEILVHLPLLGLSS